MEREPFQWNGVLDHGYLFEPLVAEGHRLADASKAGDWPMVFRLLDNGATINWWRPDGTAWFTPLHQAAWHGAPADVARELIDRGALRTLTDARGRTAYDVCLERHGGRSDADALFDVLLPPAAPLPPHRVRALDHHLASVIDGRIKGVLFDGRNPREMLRYPPVSILHELPEQRLWFPVPGMYGGFLLSLHGDELHSKSWCRVVGGSGQRHVITTHGATLVSEGFV